jgi:RimJ/RimL family protein N-acetyltransferase
MMVHRPSIMTNSFPNPIPGKSVRLRALERADLEQLRTFVNDPEVMQFSNVFWPIDDGRQDRWFASVSQSHDVVWFGIVEVVGEVEKLVGTCCLVGIDWVSRLAELRIRIGDRQAWGRGLGSEATRLLLRYGFEDLNLDRIWLRVYASNSRAIHLYQKLGFQQEGRLRRAAHIKGIAEDVILMGLLREEWVRHGGQ